MKSTFERIVELIKESDAWDPEVELTMETTFNELDMDSLDLVELIMACENEFGVELGEAEEPPKNMGEFVALVDSYL